MAMNMNNKTYICIQIRKRKTCSDYMFWIVKFSVMKMRTIIMTMCGLLAATAASADTVTAVQKGSNGGGGRP